MSKRRRQWPLARITKACRSAPAVWLALLELGAEKGSPVVTPTRGELSKTSGIQRVRTISTALSILVEAGWIRRVHVPVLNRGSRHATLLRITLCRMGQKSTH